MSHSVVLHICSLYPHSSTSLPAHHTSSLFSDPHSSQSLLYFDKINLQLTRVKVQVKLSLSMLWRNIKQWGYSSTHSQTVNPSTRWWWV